MNDANDSENGILYVAFGEQWREETRRSLTSLRKVSRLPACVVTDVPWDMDPKPDQFIVREHIPGFASKPKVLFEVTPFENTLFLDTDTIVTGDPSAAFGLLNHYDIGVRFDGPMLRVEPDLVFHTQCNSGVILFKHNEVVADVFRRWNEEYDEALKHRTSTDTRGLGDQRYLAIAIAKSRARPVHLSEYLHFAVWDVMTTYSPPIVFHGRLKHMELFADEMNAKWDTKKDWHVRLWLPSIRGLLPAGVRRSDPLLALALILRRFWNDTRRNFPLRRAR